jgi:hypothetical protein
MALYFVQKIFRRDFMYYVPLPSTVSVPVSVIARVMVKTVTDFTGCMAFRNSKELGGAYFSFNLASSLISLPVITYLHQEHAVVDEESGVKKLGADMLWAFSTGIVLSWAVMFGYFILRVIVPKHRETFWSTLTAWEEAERIFLDNEEDEERTLIFKRSIFLWSGVKEEVKAWTMASWETWDREKPEWFTKKFVSSVPDEFIPQRFLAKLGATRKRRGSAAGSVRERFREQNAVSPANFVSTTSF